MSQYQFCADFPWCEHAEELSETELELSSAIADVQRHVEFLIRQAEKNRDNAEGIENEYEYAHALGAVQALEKALKFLKERTGR